RDRATQRLDELFRDRKAQAGAFATRAVRLPEGFEHAGLRNRIHSDACVAYLDVQHTAVQVHRQAHLAFLRVPDAVRQQVEDYLQQLASVDVERVREPVHVENEREAARGRERLDRRAHVVDEPEYV